MTTPQITMAEIDAWLEAETPDWAKGPYQDAFQSGMAKAILWALANGGNTAELAARIKRAQPKAEVTV